MAGSATADTSASARREQFVVTVCQVGLLSNAEQPEPAPFHADSVQPRLLPDRFRLVPPTDVTNRDDAGNSAPVPLSPELTVMATPGWFRNWLSIVVCPLNSPPPHELETYLAPWATAWLMAVYRSSLLEFASTSRMWHCGHTAETMSTSREISPAQPVSLAGSGLVWPFWLIFRKQPLAVVVGSSNASTIATVAAAPPDGSLYALCRSAGPYPDGVAFGARARCGVMSVRRSAKQDAVPGLVACAHECTTAGPAGPVLAADAIWAAVSAVATSPAALSAPMAAVRRRILPPSRAVAVRASAAAACDGATAAGREPLGSIDALESHRTTCNPPEAGSSGWLRKN